MHEPEQQPAEPRTLASSATAPVISAPMIHNSGAETAPKHSFLLLAYIVINVASVIFALSCMLGLSFLRVPAIPARDTADAATNMVDLVD
jgi:hypothetical protein